MMALERMMEGYRQDHEWNSGPLMAGLKGVFTETRDILFHPSSGEDLTPILYFNEHWTEGLRHPGPELIIRCDAMEWETVLSRFRFIDCQETVTFYRPEVDRIKPRLRIGRIRLMGRDVWVMEFMDRKNEELLKIFLEEGLQIRYIYSTCDGMMSGRGTGDPHCIPTLFYSYLYESLGVVYHISEYIRSRCIDDYAMRDVQIQNVARLARGLRNRRVAERILSGIGDNYQPPPGYDCLKIGGEDGLVFFHRSAYKYGMYRRVGDPDG